MNLRRFAGGLKKRISPRRTRLSPADEKRASARIRAENARDIGDWVEAARQYALLLEGDDADVSNRVQYAHALKEGGRLAEAEAVYRQAVALRRDERETYLHLAHVLKLQGRPEDAKDIYAEALLWNPGFAAARDELIAMGARGRLPHHAYGRDAVTERLAGLGKALNEVRDLASEWRLAGAYPVQAWDAFRTAHPLGTPPPHPASAGFLVIVDAGEAQPSDVRATLNSLLDQSIADWRAVVVGDAALAAHPVASLAARDARIVFAVEMPAAVAERASLMTDAGVVLASRALEWFGWAQALGGADAVYGDHDSHSRHWRTGEVFFDPALFAAPDLDDLDTTPVVPAAVLLRAGLTLAPDWRGSEGRRAAILSATEAKAVAHVPRVLVSRWTDGPATDLATEAQTPPVRAQPEPLQGRILVVIPTRDEAAMLEACVNSLRRKAARPADLDVVVLDNRSQASETADLLRQMNQDGRARSRAMDEPFNWARFNNLAADGDAAEILVFANNDLEALSDGWDDCLRLDLARPEIGVVGARLLYPDGTLQHAGAVLGANAGRPVHEGLHSRPGEPGPLARWSRRRCVSAVTGAFMALRGDTFRQLGGFDEDLAVSYNDIDLCLKARAHGLKVLYDPGIVMTHHESKTRGYNDNPERQRWDDGELDKLHARWGSALLQDMSVNPQWVSAHSRVFDGFRDVGLGAVADWVRQAARPNPWLIEGDEQVGGR